MKDTIIAQWADYQNAKAVDVEFNGYGMFDYKGDLNGFMGDIIIEINSPNGYSQIHPFRGAWMSMIMRMILGLQLT